MVCVYCDNGFYRILTLGVGQNPEVLFITCSDSRIDPNMVTQTGPGDLFICRNAGNVVPPHSNQTGGMTASIEFAVAALGVEHIVICGHTDCGAMKGALAPEALDELPHVKEWLGHCRGATEVVKHKHGSVGSEHLDEVTKENVLLQIQHLKTHPSVAGRLSKPEKFSVTTINQKALSLWKNVTLAKQRLNRPLVFSKLQDI